MNSAIRIGAGRAQGLSPWARFGIGSLVLIVVMVILGSLARQYVLAQITNMEKTATLNAADAGWTEASTTITSGMELVSFVLTCTPGPDGDDYSLTGNFLMDRFSNSFRLPKAGFFGCKPNLEDSAVAEGFVTAIFKAMGGESKAQHAQELYRSFAESIVNVLKAKMPFLGF